LRPIRAAVLTGALLSAVAAAAGEPPGAAPASQRQQTGLPWFADIGAGIGFARPHSLVQNDLVGAAFTTNPVSGAAIRLSDVARTDASAAAMAAAGIFVTDRLYLKAAYRHFGKSTISGFGTFGPGNFQQIQSSRAQGVFAGLGVAFDLTPALYIDASAEAGAAFIRSDGMHDANLFPRPFPARSTVNPAVGAMLTLGYRMTGTLAVTLGAGYFRLGEAATGTTCHCIPGTPGEHASVHLTSRVNLIPVLLGIRVAL
jgi:hypothetical protein